MTPRIRRFLLAVAATLLLVAAPAGAQSDDFVIENIDASGYPLVRAVVSGPRASGDLDDAFIVVEDGEELGADVVRLRSDELNVVIALDVSGSMDGEPLAKAKAAVAELLAELPDEVPVSIVSFGDTAVVQSNFTVDRDATLAAVNGLIAAGQTALFDGINLGLAQLEVQGGSGAIVVLADGADSVSTSTVDDIVGRLAASSAQASFVALETFDFNAATFESMAAASSGQVLAVDDAAKFEAAFRDVAAGLGTTYEVRWKSASKDGEASVEIRLASAPENAVSQTFTHTEVAQFVPDIADDTRTVAGAGIFSNSWIPLAAGFFVSVGLVVLFFLMRTSERSEERRTERQAQKANKALSDDVKPEKAKRSPRAMLGFQSKLNDISAQVLEVNNRGRSLDDTLDRAGLAVRSNEFVVFCAAVVLASLVVGVLLFGIPFFLLALVFPGVGIPMFLRIATNRRRKQFVKQLGDTLQLMSGSLSAGYGLGQTLDSVARETESPTCEEFSRVVMETRLGRSLEDALDAMSYRINAPDFDWVVDAIKIQSSVGGNLSEIIEQVGETIRARVRIKRQVDALTAEGKISAMVLFFLPFGLCGFIFMSNPAYLEPLLSTGTGYVLLGAAGTMLTLGGLWLKKLVNPEF